MIDRHLRFVTMAVLMLALAVPAFSAEDATGSARPSLTMIHLDTESLDRQARAGGPLVLPFERADGTRVDKVMHLSRIRLRADGFRGAIIKDGLAGRGQILPLPDSGTYQGRVGERGSTAVTVTPRAVEGHFIDPDGWSVIEPLEPLLRQWGIARAEGEGLLRRFNHVLYSASRRDTRSTLGFMGKPDVPTCGMADQPMCIDQPPAPSAPATPPVALRLRVVLDGDPEFAAMYPLDSVMPFWRKQEAMLNNLDWLTNCLEPEADASSDDEFCHNDFDGGSNAFRARVVIEGLEAWTSGGPRSADRSGLLRESIRATHQAEPPCCGPPHTAGKADVVVFLSGRSLEGGAGLAAGIAGLGVYADAQCHAEDPCCHHAVSQMSENGSLDGSAYQQLLLFAHEVGHVLGGQEDAGGFPAEWLDRRFSGPTLMHSSFGFSTGWVFQYSKKDARDAIAPVMLERLSPVVDEEVPQRR